MIPKQQHITFNGLTNYIISTKKHESSASSGSGVSNSNRASVQATERCKESMVLLEVITSASPLMFAVTKGWQNRWRYFTNGRNWRSKSGVSCEYEKISIYRAHVYIIIYIIIYIYRYIYIYKIEDKNTWSIYLNLGTWFSRSSTLRWQWNINGRCVAGRLIEIPLCTPGDGRQQKHFNCGMEN